MVFLFAVNFVIFSLRATILINLNLNLNLTTTPNHHVFVFWFLLRPGSGALILGEQKKEEKKKERKKERKKKERKKKRKKERTTGQKCNGLPYSIGRR